MRFPPRAVAAVQAIVDGLPAGERAPLARPEKGNAPAQPRRVEEALDVTQGKLAMGFRTCIDAWDEDYPALMLLNAVYGGTTTSKLFLNVRERLSLCYYASSGLMKYKDVMLVSSGVSSPGWARRRTRSRPASGLQGRRLYRRRAGVGPPLGGEHPDATPWTPGTSGDYWLGS